MDETPSTHQGVPDETYHTLGPKTLWIFVLTRIHAAFVILLLAIVLFVLNGQAFVEKPIAGVNVGNYLGIAAWSMLGLFAVVFVLTFFVAWLIYINYKFMLGEDSLKIKRGILNKEEIAIPYRQIQDVNIERDLGFQMMGLSRIAILTAGNQQEKNADEEAEGILPAMDRALAEWLQGELLKRTNVQEVIEEK
jgi:uncharacterized membrane protein YdbT with pleckstrin-like domain